MSDVAWVRGHLHSVRRGNLNVTNVDILAQAIQLSKVRSTFDGAPFWRQKMNDLLYVLMEKYYDC